MPPTVRSERPRVRLHSATEPVLAGSTGRRRGTAVGVFLSVVVALAGLAVAAGAAYVAYRLVRGSLS